MKLAFVLKRLQDKNFFGGGERISFNLIKELCQRNIQVDIYCQETNISENYNINNIFFIDKDKKLNQTAEKLIDKAQYAYIFTENLEYPIDCCLAHGHSMQYRLYNARNIIERWVSFFDKKKQNFMRYQKKHLHNNKLVIVPSSICKHDYTEYLKYNKNKIKVIYPGVDIPEPNINSNKNQNKHFTFGLSAPGFTNKGGYLFILALFLLNITGNISHGKIIYPGHKNNKLVNFIIKILGLKNKIEFLNHQDNMQRFYNSIDSLVVPSSLETFGMVILESMASNTPVILSSRCGASEIIQDNINGFIFKYNNFRLIKLLNKMKYAVNNQKELNNITHNALNTAKKYNWKKYCDEFLKAIK